MFWRVDLGARGPGDALSRILAGRPEVVATAEIIARLSPDVLVLSGIDYDLHNAKLTAFTEALRSLGADLPYTFAPVPNSASHSGIDLNGDGISHGPDDMNGYAEFPGERSLAVLSRFPLVTRDLRNFTPLLWAQLPGTKLYSGVTEQQRARHRLSSTAHFELPVTLPDGSNLRLLTYQAGPPVFGHHADRNLHRNHDETVFWKRLLDGDLPYTPPKQPFVLIGGSNLDPNDGDGLHMAMRSVLAHPALQDPRPASLGAAAQANPDHVGPAELDTVEWTQSQGNLRVSYILPSTDLTVPQAGTFWPPPNTDMAKRLAATGTAHKPVWVDILLN